MQQLKIIDLFCGTGGFSHGLMSADSRFKTVFGLDVLPIAGETFSRNHKDAISIVSDIRKVRRSFVSEQIKTNQVDVIVGGPPCQGFSSLRPFRSSTEDDPRNSLFEEYASFVNYFRPKAFVLENVVGLVTYKNGNTIDAMENCFHELGYDTEWRILNAAHYGVPQKRERLIMIGVEKGGKIKFPEPTHYFSGDTIGVKDRQKLISTSQFDLFTNDKIILKPAVTVMNAISDLTPICSGEISHEYLTAPQNEFQKLMRFEDLNEVSLHQATAHSKKMLEIISHAGKNISCIPKHLISSGFSSCYSRLDADEPSVTITVNFVHPASNRCIHPYQNRALTPREGARLQSFNDSYQFAGNRSQITKQIGNAVPPLLGKAIGDALKSIL